MSHAGTHAAGGAVAGLAVGQLVILTAPHVDAIGDRNPVLAAAAITLIAATTGGGRLSPDVDQFKAWRSLDRWLPDEWLGAGGPLQHRGITHWWGTTLALALAWCVLLAAIPPLTSIWWAGAGVVTGWASHLALDCVFGLQVRSPDGAVIVRAGIPMAPWWAHRGGWFRSGDIGSQTAGGFLTVVGLAQAALLVWTANTWTAS